MQQLSERGQAIAPNEKLTGGAGVDGGTMKPSNEGTVKVERQVRPGKWTARRIPGGWEYRGVVIRNSNLGGYYCAVFDGETERTHGFSEMKSRVDQYLGCGG